ncbi:MAG: hypothetical protein AB8G15_03740 [Saprospiraceae bacterium]
MKLKLSLLVLLGIVLLTSSCKKEEDNDPEVVGGPPTSGYYFYGKIDGSEQTVKGTNGIASGQCGSYYENGGLWVLDIMNPNVTDAEIVMVQSFSDVPDANEFYSMYEPGTKSFGSCNGSKNGVELFWTDSAGEKWSSVGDQTGSEFKITSRSEFNGTSTVVSGTFNCKLYNGAAVKEIESGQYRMEVGLF